MFAIPWTREVFALSILPLVVWLSAALLVAAAAVLLTLVWRFSARPAPDTAH